MDAKSIDTAEAIIGHRFADPGLLRTALTHPSYAAEHVDTATYDRLEFLGDAVLGFVVSGYVFDTFPEASEGVLSRRKHHAVSREALAGAAEALGLAPLVMLGTGAHAAGERLYASVLENTIEAVIAAVYLDGGLEPARAFIERVLHERLRGDTAQDPDSKGALQEWSQAASQSLPAYRIVSVAGPAHKRHFSAEVSVQGEILGTGEGATKQAAEKAAAFSALRALGLDRGRAGTDRTP